jgi:acetyltransferase
MARMSGHRSAAILRASLERPVTLRDGRVLRLRAIRPDDTETLAELQRRSTAEDLRMRFFGPIRPGAVSLTRMLCEFDRERHVAVAAYDPDGPGGESVVLGVVRLILEPTGRGATRADAEPYVPEFALFVRSDFKGHGLGHALMREMLGWARTLRLPKVEGQILWENQPMLRLVRDLGARTRPAKDDLHVIIATFDIAHDADAVPGEPPRVGGRMAMADPVV